MLLDSRAEGMRQQLGAEADAQHRLPALQGRLDAAQLGAQVRALGLLLDVHRAAQHDQAVIALDRGRGLGITLEVDEAQPMAAPRKRLTRSARRVRSGAGTMRPACRHGK
jgi:hypothetical protein